MSYNSKYTGAAVEAKLDAVDGKVDKVSGKGLSTEDFTTALKTKLSGIDSGAEVNVQSNWEETNVTSDAYIKNKPSFHSVATSGNYNELLNKPSIPTVPASLKNPYALSFGSKSYDGSSAITISESDIVSDIATIRSGASKGATALQSYTEKYTGTYSKPSGGIPKTDLDSSVQTSLGKADSALQSYTEKYTGTVTGVKINGVTKTPTGGTVDLGTVITSHQDISGKADKNSLAAVATSGKYSDLSGLPTIPTTMAWSSITGKPTFATVATSGSYNDLSNKPSIPSAVTESTVSGWGFTKNTGTYSKPSTGIPKTDLASAVQTSLGKADSALQSFTESDPVFKASAAASITSADISNWNAKTSNVGTITGIKMNGASKGTSGVVDLGTVITSHQDISGKLDKTAASNTYLSKSDASSTYLTKTDASSTYLGKSANAASATKATQDGSGNTITSTYATKTELSNAIASAITTALNTAV